MERRGGGRMSESLARLRKGQAVFGLMQTYPIAAVTEIMVWSGYDFVILDSEHGVADEGAQLDALRVIEGSSAFSIVRVRPGDESAVARYLDFGADGLMIPDVRTAVQAEQVARVAYERWTGGLRGDRYGRSKPNKGQMPLLIALIEAPEGVANVEAILSVRGIEGVVIGAGDLSTTLGTPGNFSTPAYLAAVERVERAALARGKILGAKPDKDSPIAGLFERGYRLFMIGRDMPLLRSVLAGTLASAVSQVPAP